MLKIVGAFVLVIALLLIFLKLLGRLTRGKSLGGGKGFSLRATMTLDARRYLAAVELDGRLLVVAVSGDRISPIAHWPAGAARPEPVSGFHPGTLGLEPEEDGPGCGDPDGGADGPLAGFPPPAGPAALRGKPVPRPGVREPAFLRGETEEEADVPGAAPPESFSLGIDEEAFDGPQTDDELRFLEPRRQPAAGPGGAPEEGDPLGADDPGPHWGDGGPDGTPGPGRH
jgi:hypothetical protein